MEQPSVQSSSNPINESNTPNTPPINAPFQPEKKSNKWLILFLILLFLSAVGVAGYFAYQNYQLKNNQKIIPPKPYPIEAHPTLTQSPLVQSTASPSPSIKPEQKIPDNWKTYINEKGGYYSIKYPPEVKVQEGPGYEDRIQETNFTLFGPKYQGPGEFTDGFGITIAVLKNSENKTPKQLTEELLIQSQKNIQDGILEGDIAKCVIEEIVRDNTTGARFNLCTKAPGVGIVNIYEWFVKNKTTYQIYGVLQNNDYLNTFNNILSTLMF